MRTRRLVPPFQERARSGFRWRDESASPFLFVALLIACVAGAADPIIEIGGVRLRQVYHNDQVTGTNDHFGSLLFDSNGHLVKHNGNRTWLYCGAKEGKWVSFVRELNLDTLESTPRKKIINTYQRDRWAAAHLGIKVADDLYVVFFSTGKQIRAAVALKPDGPFIVDAQFGIRPKDDWERGCSIESDCGFVKISENDEELRIWKLYDTLCKGSVGQNGWAEVRIGKRSRSIELVRRHPNNPIKLLRPGFIAARTGGNVDSRIRFNGRYALYYLSKKDSRTYRMAVALASDPLMQNIVDNQEVFDPLGTEGVIEKFQCFMHNGQFNLIYENADTRNDWRTSIRRYEILSGTLR